MQDGLNHEQVRLAAGGGAGGVQRRAAPLRREAQEGGGVRVAGVAGRRGRGRGPVPRVPERPRPLGLRERSGWSDTAESEEEEGATAPARRRQAVEARFIDAHAGEARPRGRAPKRARNWVFTLNRYSAAELAAIDALVADENADYVCRQGELAPNTGTRHLQGVITFRNARSLGGVQELLGGRAHVEIMRGTIDEAVDYCRKDESRDPAGPAFAEFGERPVGAGAGRGSRTDVKRVLELAKSGATFPEIAEAEPDFALRYHGGIRYYQSCLSKPRNFKTVVHWYWGPTGTGKSRAAYEESGDGRYVKGPGHKWWDGYQGQETVVIDDFRPGWFSGCPRLEFAFLLHLLDRYPLKVEVKNGMTEFCARTVWITADCSPADMFKVLDVGAVAQLLRRVEDEKYFGPRIAPEGPLVAGFVPNV